MQPDVDDEPARAPRVETQRSEFLIGIAEQSELRAQTLRIERPSLDKGRFAPEAAEPWKRGVGSSVLRLKVMTGQALVQLQHLARVGRPRCKIERVEEDDARPASVR